MGVNNRRAVLTDGNSYELPYELPSRVTLRELPLYLTRGGDLKFDFLPLAVQNMWLPIRNQEKGIFFNFAPGLPPCTWGLKTPHCDPNLKKRSKIFVFKPGHVVPFWKANLLYFKKIIMFWHLKTTYTKFCSINTVGDISDISACNKSRLWKSSDLHVFLQLIAKCWSF